MSKPLISICIPTYNGEKYLAACLESVIGQDPADMEIIIVDDGSSDSSVEIIKRYMKLDKRIQLFVNKNNLGLVGNWNRCIEHSSGEWIKYVFQDDYLKKNCLSRMIEYSYEKVQLITCNRQFVFEDDANEKLKMEYITGMTSPQKIFNIHTPSFISAKQISLVASKLLTANFIGEPTVALFRRSLVDQIGYFNTNMVQLCDLEYWLRIATNYGMFYIPETMAFFRVHAESATSGNRTEKLDLADTAIMYNEFLYGEHYLNFRRQFNLLGFNRLKEVLKLRMYEINCWIKANNPVKLKMRMEMLGKKILFIDKMNSISLTTRIILPFVLARRFMYKMKKK